MLPHIEALYGGAAGGGKSDALLMAALQYVDVPGYAALCLRKTLTDLKQEEALLDRMEKWMSPFVANKEITYRRGEYKFVFPTVDHMGKPGKPATITFGYIGQSEARLRYQGIEIQFCVDPFTLVVMHDGTYKHIKDITPGMFIKTINGPRVVTKTHRVKKRAVALVTPSGYQIQGINHRILSLPFQKDAETSTLSYKKYKLSWQIDSKYCDLLVGHENQDQDLLHTSSQWISYHDLQKMGFFSSLRDGQNDFAVSDDSHQVFQQLQRLNESSVLSLPFSQSELSCIDRHGISYEQQELQERDSMDRYLSYPHQYDELLNRLEFYYQANLQRQECVALHPLLYSSHTQEYNQTSCTSTYHHPYTNDILGTGSFSCQPSFIIPFDTELELCDLTIEDQSHYITKIGMGQLINSNCAFDEVTQHKERDYTYLFSRLRKCGCYIHTDKDKDGHPIYNKDCKVCDMMRKIPIRMRGATNPGGPGHTWVRERFGLDVDPDTLKDPHPKFKGFNKSRPFIPSFIQDNKYLDQAQYKKSLLELTEEDREQLEHGNWSFVSSAKFKKTYARYYSDRGDYFFLGQLYKGRSVLKDSLVKVFQTVDPASSSKEGMGDQELFDLDKKSYTVISTWGITPCYNLLWLGMVRFRKEIPDVVTEMKHQYEMWCPQEVVAEENGLGRGVVQYAKRFGMNIKPLTKDKDKVIFANTAIIQMSKGRIWLPEWSTWKKEVEDEIFNWQGHPSEPDDIIDTLAMAAHNIDWENVPESSEEYFQKERAASYDELPYTIDIDGGESGFQFTL
jgi:predicted phage terminase large subunit-like protein